MAAATRRRRKARTQPVESTAGRDSFAAFMRRAVKALRRRAEAQDLDALVAMVELQALLALETRAAGAALHQDYSWAEIGRALGISKQAAAERFHTDTTEETA